MIKGRVMAAYEAARDSRRTYGWLAPNSGPNSDVHAAWSWLVRRQQDLCDSDGFTKKAISVIVNNWIGDGITSTPEKSTKKYAKNFEDWCDNKLSDFYERTNWYGLQNLGGRTTATRGAVIVRRRVNPDLFEKYGLVPLQVQLLEPDWLDFDKDNGTDIVFGQQFDSEGRLKGYWIRNQHPGESLLGSSVRINSTFVPKEEISIHYECLRPGQRMGVPFGAAALLTLRDMGDTRAAQMMKDKISACYFGVTTTEEPSPGKQDEVFTEIEPGMNYVLPPGKSFAAFTPPSSGDFVQTQKHYAHEVAAAYEITYEDLTGDMSDVNYSSMRGSWLNSARRIAHLRGNVTYPGLLDPVCRWHDELARQVGLLKGPGHRWKHTPPRREMMDPTKEIPALIEGIKAGIFSLKDVQLSHGYMPDQVLQELEESIKNAREKGILLSIDNGTPATSQQSQPESQSRP